MQLQRFHCVYWLKRMSMHRICYKYCECLRLLDAGCSTILMCCLFSAELEMTVALLVQIDKLVMLIESPVFTCKAISVRLHPNVTANPELTSSTTSIA
jgi:hypothetical protein